MIQWRLLVLVPVLALIAWLATAESPTDRRVRLINQRFEEGVTYGIDERRLRRFSERAVQISQNAGVTDADDITINQGVSRYRLDLIVVPKVLEALTGVTAGHALYDIDLDAIMISEYLLEPVDVPFLGNRGVNMMGVDEIYDALDNIASFVLAHELGHRVLNHQSSMMFPQSWKSVPIATVQEELDADAEGVRILLDALRSETGSPELDNIDIPDFLGLANAGLEPTEMAISDIVNILYTHTLAMMFSASPYDPFDANDTHPTFLERTLKAINLVTPASSERVMAHLPVIQQTLTRTQSVISMGVRSIRLPTPVSHLRADAEHLWLGTTEIPEPTLESLQPTERLYRLPHGRVGSLKDKPVATGMSGEQESGGIWLDDLFDHGKSNLNLPPNSETRSAAVRVRLFERDTTWQPDGLGYIGDGWESESSSGETMRFSINQRTRDVAALLGAPADVELGEPFVVASYFVVPALITSLGHLVAIEVHSDHVALAQAPFALDAQISQLGLDIETVKHDESTWYGLGRQHSEDDYSRWILWQLDASGDHRVLSSDRLMDSFIGSAGDQSFGRELSAVRGSLIPLGDKRFISWYDSDSVWLTSPQGHNVVFHPALLDLQVTRGQSNTVYFWMENAHKIYYLPVHGVESE